MNKVFKLLGVLFLTVLFSFTTFKEKKIIIIDAGHGGQDLGVSKNGINEKDIVLDIAKRIQQLNKNQNIEIILTRNSDSFASLNERSSLGNLKKPTMIISLHVNNSTDKEKSGSEIFAKAANMDLAKKLASKFDNCTVSDENFYLLRNSEQPAMMLELGYMSNDNERAFLTNENGKKEISAKILEFITEN